MRAAISKFIGLMIFISAACAFADTKLPKCVIYTFGNCQGSLKYPNGDIYTGEFNYGQPNGVGKMIYANGDLYAGNFFEGQKHGIGDYTWADGNRYIGQFIGGNLEGRGAYYFLGKNKTNPDKYVGDFKKNAFNGDGIYTYGNGAVVSGRFKDGKKVNVSTPVQAAEIKRTPDVVGAENELNKLGAEALNKVNGISENNQAPVNKELMALSDYSDGVINGNSLSERNESTLPRGNVDKEKFFFSGSMNSVNIIAWDYLNNNGTRTDQTIPLPIIDSPFSLGFGYRFNENYGVELGFKYHGHRYKEYNIASLTENDSWKSSAWSLGGFLDLPINSSFALNIKGGIQNTDTTFIQTRLVSYTSSQLTIDNLSSKVWGSYYGVGLSYRIDKNNSIFLDWTRARTSLPTLYIPPVSIDLNIDATGFGFKYSF